MRLTSALRWLILAQAALAAAAFVNEFVAFCTDCAKDGSVLIAASGLAFYVTLAVLIWRRKAETLVAPALLVGLGVHSILMLQTIQTGRSCWMCTAAAVGSLLLALAAVAPDVRLARAAVFCWPLGAATAAAALPFVTEHRPPEIVFEPPPIELSKDAGEIIVFVDLGCGACKGFHLERTPKLLERFVTPGIARFRYVAVRGESDDPKVVEALLACYAAERQGKGDAVAGVLMENFAKAGKPEDLLSLLVGLVDLDLLKRDMATDEVRSQIKRMKDWAERTAGRRRPAVWVHARGKKEGRLIHVTDDWPLFERKIILELGTP